MGDAIARASLGLNPRRGALPKKERELRTLPSVWHVSRLTPAPTCLLSGVLDEEKMLAMLAQQMEPSFSFNVDKAVRLQATLGG